MSQAENAAIEVNDVTSAASEIERRMTESEAPEKEVITEEKSADDAETQDELNEPDDESETESEEDSEEPEAEQTETFETAADLAEALNMPLEDFMATIKTKVKINGEESEVSLNDLKNGYQMESDYRRKTSELAEHRKAFEQETQQAKVSLQSRLQEVENLTTTLENQMTEEFNAINWAQLEAEDREEWLVQRQKFGERYQNVQAIKQQAQTEQQRQQQEMQAQQSQAMHEHLMKENELLLTAIPEWSDPAVREAEDKQMIDFLGQYGFSADEVGMVSDHRLVKLVRDAFKGKGMNEKVDIAKKKVKTLPKIVKPGVKVDKKALAAKANKSKSEKFAETGSREDLVAALIDRM